MHAIQYLPIVSCILQVGSVVPNGTLFSTLPDVECHKPTPSEGPSTLEYIHYADLARALVLLDWWSTKVGMRKRFRGHLRLFRRIEQ